MLNHKLQWPVTTASQKYKENSGDENVIAGIFLNYSQNGYKSPEIALVRSVVLFYVGSYELVTFAVDVDDLDGRILLEMLA